MKGMLADLPPAQEAFVQALRNMRGDLSLRAIGGLCGKAPGSVQRYFAGAKFPDMETTRRITEACGGDWEEIEPLRRAVNAERRHMIAQKRRGEPSLARRVATLEDELSMVRKLVENLTSTSTTDKEGPTMSVQKGFILIRRLPDDTIKAHTTPFRTFAHAARAAGQSLQDSQAAGSAAARLFADALARRPLGTIWGHDSGCDFRILRAHLTTDAVAITPGLRVITNDLKWGFVEPTQFMNEADSFGPGGEYFDDPREGGWYLLTHEDGVPYAKFNGARLATKSPF